MKILWSSKLARWKTENVAISKYKTWYWPMVKGNSKTLIEMKKCQKILNS